MGNFEKSRSIDSTNLTPMEEKENYMSGRDDLNDLISSLGEVEEGSLRFIEGKFVYSPVDGSKSHTGVDPKEINDSLKTLTKKSEKNGGNIFIPESLFNKGGKINGDSNDGGGSDDVSTTPGVTSGNPSTYPGDTSPGTTLNEGRE